MEKTQDNSPAEQLKKVPAAGSPVRVYRNNDALLPASVIGGLAGMLAGTLPVAVWYAVFRTVFSPVYVFLPLLVYLGLKLFRGYRGRRGLLVLCLFTAAGFYLSLLSPAAVASVLRYGMLFMNVPLVTVTLIGQRGILTGSVFSSAYVFPFVFSLLGVFLSEELLMREREPAPSLKPAEQAG